MDDRIVELGPVGKDDQVRAVNLITPGKRKQAMALVKEGVSFSMARDAETEKAVDNAAPIVHQMTRVGVRNQSGDFGASADTFFMISIPGLIPPPFRRLTLSWSCSML